jgi:dTMP kinase
MSDRDSFFLVIEGLDGSGKTEISRRLAELMRATFDEHVMLTYEPHDPSAAGLYIRRVLRRKIMVSPRTLALAFALNRADHNERIITPFLEQGDRRVVLCDRYVLSSLVYNTSPDLPMRDVWDLNSRARRPDLTLFLDATAEICYARMGSRGGNRDLFETNLAESRTRYFEAIDFLRQRGEHVQVIDANPDLLVVLNSIIDALKAHGPRWMTLQKLMFLEATAPAILTPPPLELDRWMRDLIARYPADALAEAAADDGIRRLVATEVNRLPLDELTALMMNFLETDRRYRFESAWPGQPIDYTVIRPGGESGGLVILQDERRWEGVARALESDFIAPHYSIRRDSIQFIVALDPSHAGEEVAQFVPDTGSVPVEVYGRGTLIQYFTRHITRRVQNPPSAAAATPEPQLSMELPDEALAENWSLAAALAIAATGSETAEALAQAQTEEQVESWEAEANGETWQAGTDFEAADAVPGEDLTYPEAHEQSFDAAGQPALRFESDIAPPVEELKDTVGESSDPMWTAWEQQEAAQDAPVTALLSSGQQWTFAPDHEAEAAEAVDQAEMSTAGEYAAPAEQEPDWAIDPSLAQDENEALYGPSNAELSTAGEYALPVDDGEGWSFEPASPPELTGSAAQDAWTFEAAAADDTFDPGAQEFSFDEMLPAQHAPAATASDADLSTAAEYAAHAGSGEHWPFEDAPAQADAWPEAATSDADHSTAAEYAAHADSPAEEDWPFEEAPVESAPAADYLFVPFEEAEAPPVDAFAPPQADAPAPAPEDNRFEFDAPKAEFSFDEDVQAQSVRSPDAITAPPHEFSFAPPAPAAPAETNSAAEYDYDPDEELPWRARRGALRSKTDSAEIRRVTAFDPFQPPAAPPGPRASGEDTEEEAG